MEAVATVVTLKDFADSSTTMLIPMLEVALNDSSVSETQEVLQELVDTYGHVKDKLSKLKFQHTEISGEARTFLDDMASREQEQKTKLNWPVPEPTMQRLQLEVEVWALPSLLA